MGLLQKAAQTYDSNKDLVGVMREDHEILAPIGHAVTRAQIEITLNAEGKFLSARAVDKSDPKIVIPVTEESCGRTSAPCAHPLCDQIGYVAVYNSEKHRLYIDQLKAWQESEYTHPKLEPILKYAQGGSVLKDLDATGIIEVGPDGNPLKEKDTGKMLIRWRVTDPDGEISACWLDKSLFEAYTAFYRSKIAENEKSVCMISGKEDVVASQHAKGIVPANGNAKLISSNDKTNFTYRGRFTDDLQASSVSYEASQKAHNALRWLVAEQGVIFGGRTFLCWNPDGVKVTAATGPFRAAQKVITKPSEYQKDLRKTLKGYKTSLKPNDAVVIAAFDAATSGRLSLTYYNELTGSDFLDRLYDWDAACCWYNGPYGIQTPSLFQIVNYAYGVQRNEKNQIRMVTDDRILRQQMQRLVACRIDRARIPSDLLHSLTCRASMPQNYDPGIWRKMIFTACALLHADIMQKKGDESMSWELDKKDRSFQYGRLLAAMERVEADYYYKTGEERQTMAIKSLNEFRRSPFHTYERINRHLITAYVPRLDHYAALRYERLKQEIMQIIRSFPEEEIDRPLEDLYLLGYDLQKNEFFRKKDMSAENKTEGEIG